MSEAHPLFAVLCKSADADCATALERLVREAPDRRLNRINVLDFARREGLDEQRAITTFLHATQIGLLDMSWNVLCPSCGGGRQRHAQDRALPRILLRVLRRLERT